jgi:hypothetical protein
MFKLLTSKILFRICSFLYVALQPILGPGHLIVKVCGSQPQTQTQRHTHTDTDTHTRADAHTQTHTQTHRHTHIGTEEALVPLMTYGAPVWEEAIKKQKLLRKMQSTQRLINIKIAKAYRIISFEASCLSAGVQPI